MESITNLLIYILIHALGFGLGLLLLGVVYFLKEHVDKINWLLRFLLIPIVMILILFAITAISNNLLALLAIFWGYDVEANIWFYSNIIIPALTSYALLWAVYFITPFQKVIVTGFIGVLWIAMYLFATYEAIRYGVAFDGGYLFETFNIESSGFGTALFVASSIIGAILAIKHSYTDDIDNAF